jgi:subtilase family serine protease
MAAALVPICVGAIAVLESGSAVAASAVRATLAGTAAPSSATVAGAVNPASTVKFELVMQLRNQSGAEALVKAVSTPGSASYHHYIDAAQWEAQFSPSSADIAAAKNWLQSQGFTVGAVSKDGITISASGTAAKVESAFGTTLRDYRVDGRTERMAAKDLSVPSSLSGIVTGALGVNQAIADPADASDSSAAATPARFPSAPNAFLTHGPCSSSYGSSTTTTNPPFGNGYPATDPNVVCGYTPGQLRSAYGVTSADTGAGATVAIVDAYASGTQPADATQYFANHDPSNPFSNADYTQALGQPFDDQDVCGASGWATEQAIDIEAVHAMAPDAHILYVGAQDCENGLFNADQYVIDNGLANVITNSWGDTGGDLFDDTATHTAYDDIFLLAAATGITVQYSSGDDGDNFALLGVSTPDYPASSPLVTAVGGTSLEIGANGQRIGELGWSTGRSFLCTASLVGDINGCTSSAVGTWLPVTSDGGSGGFTSYYYLQPSYQAGIVPAALAERNAALFGPVPLRVIPDISLDADPGTGFLIGLTQRFPNGVVEYSETRYGGTSLASPLLAGMVADADSVAGVSLGFLNPLLYGMDTSDPSSIEDVVPSPTPVGNVRTDYAGAVGEGLNNGSFYAEGTVESFRELYYSGLETYCDATGNCASRPQTQSTAPGYDSLTGLGAPGANFINTLASFGS